MPLAVPFVAIVLAALVLAPGAHAQAQAQFDRLGKRHFPPDMEPSVELALGDVDGDGDPDVVFANGRGPFALLHQNRLYVNDGAGVFADTTAASMPPILGWTAAVASGDVDGDGDLDLIFGANGQNRLHRNDGNGVFTNVTQKAMPALRDNTIALAAGDVDGDGDLDLVTSNDAQQNRLYLNNGTGVFRNATEGRMPPDTFTSASVALGDVDGDGDNDLVFASSQQNRLYLNNGSGAFTDATAARMPVDLDISTAVALGDVDGDGDSDLVFGNGGVLFAHQTTLYLNDGTGTFTNGTAGRLPVLGDYTTSIALEDVDRDGDCDLLVGNSQRFVGGQNRLYLNDGAGIFTDATATHLPQHVDRTQAVGLADVDGDGDSDLVVANDPGRNRLYLNSGTGVFRDATVAPMPVDDDKTNAMALGDVDGDGDLDVIVGNGVFPIGVFSSFGDQSRLYLNTGAAGFVDATAARMPSDNDATNGVALGDVDGDGDLDLVLGNSPLPSGQQNRLYLNDGLGTFADATRTRLPANRDNTNAVALGDVDGDGDLDLIVGNTGRNGLYLNDGSGTFVNVTAARMPRGLDSTLSVALGDVDGDGDPDIVCGNGLFAGEENALYLNDGTGTFTNATAGRLPLARRVSAAVALGDVDGDGDADLVFGNGGIAWSGQNSLYLNDGSGVFADATATRMPPLVDGTRAVALTDVDGDGDPDLIFGNGVGTLGEQNRLYLNDGTGTFTDATVALLPQDNDSVTAMVAGDADGDGDADLVLGVNGQNGIYLNLLRQLDTPLLVTTGRPYRLDGYARAALPRPLDVMVPFLSTGTARIPIPPLGTLGLDPSRMVPLAPFLIAQPAGVASVSYPVPNTAGLVGVTLYAQGVLVQNPLPAHLTNVTADRIGR